MGVDPGEEGSRGIPDLPVRNRLLETVLGELVAIEQDLDVGCDLLHLLRFGRAVADLHERVEGVVGTHVPPAVGCPEELLQLLEHQPRGVLDRGSPAFAGAREQGPAAFRIVEEEVLAVADQGIVRLETFDHFLLRLKAAQIAPYPVPDLARQLPHPATRGDDGLALGGEPRDVVLEGIEVGVGLVPYTPDLGPPFRGNPLARADGLDHLHAGGGPGLIRQALEVDVYGAGNEAGADDQRHDDVDEAAAHWQASSRGGGGGPRGWVPARVWRKQTIASLWRSGAVRPSW